MSLTLGNWLFLGILAIILIVIVVVVGCCSEDFPVRNIIITSVISLIILVGLAIGLNWYNTSTASGKRSYKDFKSEINDGIYREITITNDDGKVIYDYTGKRDIEEQNNTDGSADVRKLKFENEQGKRVIIYYGITDTVKIIEKERGAKNGK